MDFFISGRESSNGFDSWLFTYFSTNYGLPDFVNSSIMCIVRPATEMHKKWWIKNLIKGKLTQ